MFNNVKLSATQPNTPQICHRIQVHKYTLYPTSEKQSSEYKTTAHLNTTKSLTFAPPPPLKRTLSVSKLQQHHLLPKAFNIPTNLAGAKNYISPPLQKEVTATHIISCIQAMNADLF